MESLMRISTIAVALFWGSTLLAQTPAEKCEAAKKAEAGKYAACRLKAESKLVTSGDMDKYNIAIGKCATKLSDKFDKLEAGGACPSSGDAGAIVAFLASCSDGVSTSTNGGGTLPTCGDGDINVAGEECDGVDVGGRICDSFGFTGGTLACTGACKFDTSLCVTGAGSECGNGVVDGTEECDQSDLRNDTCESLEFAGGTLKCGANCAHDTSDCWNERFSDNADGTVTDHANGLMWEKKVKANNTVDAANLQDADNKYPWGGRCSIAISKICQPNAAAAAACAAGAEFGTGGCSQCGVGEGTCDVTGGSPTVWQWLLSLNAASFGGHADWRIPRADELAALVDRSVYDPSVSSPFAGASCGAACGDVTSPACSCTSGDFYWTATSYADSPDSLRWVVEFYAGETTGATARNAYFVRAVRDSD